VISMRPQTSFAGSEIGPSSVEERKNPVWRKKKEEKPFGRRPRYGGPHQRPGTARCSFREIRRSAQGLSRRTPDLASFRMRNMPRQGLLALLDRRGLRASGPMSGVKPAVAPTLGRSIPATNLPVPQVFVKTSQIFGTPVRFTEKNYHPRPALRLPI